MTHDYTSLLFLIAPVVLGSKWSFNKYTSYVVNKEKKRAKNLSNARFVCDVATNHLPHVFAALEIIAKQLGVELPDPPPIRFVEPMDMEDGGEDN